MNIRGLTIGVICGIGMLATGLSAQQAKLTGAIDTYNIEVELDRGPNDTLTGRYRYAGRDAWLDLTGTAYGQDAIELTESFDGQETGKFFLEVDNTSLTGFWTDQNISRAATLTFATDLTDLLPAPVQAAVGAGVTGRYKTGGYWINPMWEPNYEIGYNGGTVDVVRISDSQLLIDFQFIVGPTYHFAVFRGIVDQKSQGVFEFSKILDGGDQPCKLTFSFDPGAISITDNNNPWACQFGARAHANFDLKKTSDIAQFRENL